VKPSPASLQKDEVNITRAQIAVLQVMQEWVRNGGGSLDIINNAELRTTVSAFLTSCNESPVSQSSDPVVFQLAQTHKTLLASFQQTFLTETRRPSLDAGVPVPSRSNSSNASTQVVVPNPDAVTAQDLVTWLETSAQAAFSSILEEVHSFRPPFY
jgi:hypothetical protein